MDAGLLMLQVPARTTCARRVSSACTLTRLHVLLLLLFVYRSIAGRTVLAW
jgi:hypothetical protein